MLRTQIGGKYHAEDDSVFRLKQLVAPLGVSVTHPLGDAIVASSTEHAFAFDPTKTSFSDVERDYYSSIRESPFHLVCNTFKDRTGYLGASASLEVAYAMCHDRPIVLVYPPAITDGVDDFVRDFILDRVSSLTVHDFFSSSDEENAVLIKRVALAPVIYDVSDDERHVINKRVAELLANITRDDNNAPA